jgi:GH15 family glucan-1,4-alpha-glucosidase
MIRNRGIHADGHLMQILDGEETDAALLVAPMHGLPLDDAVVSRTVDRVRRDLGLGGGLGGGPLIRRYRTDDGLAGREGAFLICCFWLVDALLHLDRGEEARSQFEELTALSNDLGLYPEQMAADGTFLGNFPQGFTHIGLVHSALSLDLYERHGVEAVRGTHADRAAHLAERYDRLREMWGT